MFISDSKGVGIMETVKDVGAILGYIATSMGLFAAIKAAVHAKTKRYVEETAGTEESEKIHHNLDDRMTILEKQFEEYLRRDSEFKDLMYSHIDTQQLVDRKLMANIIETLYYQNVSKETLDSNEFRRLTEVYAIYHNPPCNGNSYISEMYNTMMKWKRI